MNGVTQSWIWPEGLEFEGWPEGQCTCVRSLGCTGRYSRKTKDHLNLCIDRTAKGTSQPGTRPEYADHIRKTFRIDEPIREVALNVCPVSGRFKVARGFFPAAGLVGRVAFTLRARHPEHEKGRRKGRPF